MNTYYVYILASQRNGTLYVGMTSDLIKRVYEHKQELIKGFTKKYNVDKLVYYEEFKDMESALLREKQLKKYKRQWKENLINEMNPELRDLYEDF